MESVGQHFLEIYSDLKRLHKMKFMEMQISEKGKNTRL